MYFVLPGGPLAQLSNVSFFLAAVFGDLLLLRFFLSMAYVFLFISALLGQPRWPSAGSTDAAFLDTVIWAGLSGALHIVALVRLILDERRIRFKTDDEEQIWRFFYRRSGMGRLEMKQVLKFGRWRRVKAGEVILDPIAACSSLCLMIEGVGKFASTNGEPETGIAAITEKLVSGCFFDMRLLNVMGLYIGFEGYGPEKWFAAVAKTDCLIYEWSIEDLNTMATHCSPAVGQSWRNLLATQIGLTLAWREMPNRPPGSSLGESESTAILFGMRSRDFTDPLRGYEGRKQWTVLGLLKSAVRSFHLLMPPGIRHNNIPVHGVMARNRMIALKDSQLRVAARTESEDGWHMKEDEEASTLRALRHVESLTTLEMADVVQLARDISVRKGKMFMEGSLRSDPGPDTEQGIFDV